jgi:SAM-dependent methyltransferase
MTAGGTAAPVHTLVADGFVDPRGQHLRRLVLRGAIPDADWVAKQQASMAEYVAGTRAIPPDTLTLYRLFDAYLATAMIGRTGLRILDVGCGIGREWPPYAATIGLTRMLTGNVYVGLDPIEYDIDRREYPFVCGRIEDLPDALTDRFDAFVFATSLDHFEDIGRVASAVRRLAARDACCHFWVGLHDVPAVSEQSGARAYRRLFASLGPAGFFLRWCRLTLSAGRDYFRSIVRSRRLARGLALDALHFHYFTQADVASHLAVFGTLEQTLRVPGTNSLFATVRVDAPGS